MSERELKLASLVLGIARAKQERKERRKELKSADEGAKENLENVLKTIDAGIEASKAQRDALINELLAD